MMNCAVFTPPVRRNRWTKMLVAAFCLASFVFAMPSLVLAQISPATERQPDGEVLSRPLCSKLINRSSQTIMGTLATQKQALADGTQAAHQDNFRLAAGETKEFCVSGPFFEGRRIELILRTVIPLFECKTKLDRDIYLDSATGPDGVRRLSATCS